MPNYKALYFSLASKVANVIEYLTDAQCAAEEACLQEENTVVEVFPADANKEKE